MLRAALICLFFILRHPMWSATGQGSQNSRKKETDHTEVNDPHRTKKNRPIKRALQICAFRAFKPIRVE